MDFQQGLITTIHEYGVTRNLLKELNKSLKKRSTSILIPCLYEEFERPALKDIREVLKELYKKIDDHPRKEICMQSVKNWGLIVICENYESCVELSNNFAPEHLEILTIDPKKILEGIENAGAIFLGKWTPEAVGDYLAGPNHTLPTSGNSRFSGSLGVETFMKNTSIIEFNEESLKINRLDIINLAKSEGLHSHANSVEIRFED